MVRYDLFDLKCRRHGARHLAVTDNDEDRLRTARSPFTDHDIDLSDGSHHAGGGTGVNDFSLYTANEDPDLIQQWGSRVSDDALPLLMTTKSASLPLTVPGTTALI